METGKPNYKMIVILIWVVILWGVNAVAIKYLTQFYPPLVLAPIRLCLASLLLVPVMIVQKCWRLPRKAWPSVGGIALFCIFLHQIALTFGIKATSGTHAVLILGMNPLMTALLAGYFLKEKFTAAKAVGMVLGFGGLLFVVAANAQSGASLFGDAVMGTATLVFVIGSLFVKTATSYASPLTVTAYSHVLAAVGLGLVGFAANPDWGHAAYSSWIPVAVLLFSSFFSTALGALLWNVSIKHLGASTASLFQNGCPVIGVFASVLFLGEQLSWHHLTALVLVILGVTIGTGILPLPQFGRGKQAMDQQA